MRLRRIWLVATALLTLAGLLAGCGGGSTGSAADLTGDPAWAGGPDKAQAMRELYDAAGKAGQKEVVLYGPYAELYRPIWAAFGKRFPNVKVTAKVMAGPATVAALQAEVSSGRVVADIVMQGLEGVGVSADENLLQPYEPPTVGELPAQYRDPANRYIVQFGDIYGTVYNTAKMPADQLPKRLADLTDPRYRGLVIDDPTLGAVTAFSLMPIFNNGKLTPDFLRGLKANAKVVESATPYYNQLVTGQVTLMPWGSHQRYLRLKQAGAPLGFEAVPGMSSLVLGATGIVAGAPHPEAAKLFQAWFLTPEAQNLLVSKGLSVALMPGTSYPAGWPDYHALYNAEPQIPPNEFHHVLDRFLQFAKPVFA